MIKAVFFDRDGTLSKLVEHEGRMTAPWSFDEFEIIEVAKEAVEAVIKAGFIPFVVTNQPDVYASRLKYHDLNKMNKLLQKELNIKEVVSSLYTGSKYYKPKNGMIEFLIENYDIDRKCSYIVGDSWKDIVAGHSSGLKTIFIDSGLPGWEGKCKPDLIVKDLIEAVTTICQTQFLN